MKNAAETYLQENLNPPESELSEASFNAAEQAFLQKYLGIGLDAAVDNIPQVNPEPLSLEELQALGQCVDAGREGDLTADSAHVFHALEQDASTGAPTTSARKETEMDWPLNPPQAEEALIHDSSSTWVEELAEEPPFMPEVDSVVASLATQSLTTETAVPDMVAKAPQVVPPVEAKRPASAPTAPTQPLAAASQEPAQKEAVKKEALQKEASPKNATLSSNSMDQRFHQQRAQAAEALAQHSTKAIYAELRNRQDVQLVGFTLDGREYALPIELVQEVIRYQQPTRLPRAPRHLAGVVNLRGRITPLINLRWLLGHRNADGGDNFIIVCRRAGRSNELQIGLVVSTIANIHRPAVGAMEWDLDHNSLLGSKVLAGLMRADDRLINVLSFDQLVGTAME